MFSSAATSGWKAGVASALATMALVALAYRFPAVVEVDFGRSFASALASEGLYESEGSYRWSRGRGEILFPDPGARDPVRVELVLSGFRPKDTPQPIVVFEAGSETSRQLASRRIASYSLDTATTGVWSSTLRIQLRSDTFVPGQGDERALGVRLHRARLVLAGPASPPLKQLLASGALALLLFASLGFAGLSVRRGFSVALGFGLVLGIGFAFFRFHAALFTPAATLFLSAVFAGRSIFPSLTSFIGDSGKSAARALLEGTLTLRTPLALGAALLALLATFAGYAAAPKVELRLGSGEADPIARRFAGFDRDLDGTAFRRAFPGATLDLRDFGARRPWTVAIRAALEDEVDAPVRGVLAQAGEASLEADLGSGWSTHRFELDPPPWSWRSGHVLQFPGFGQGRKIRLASVEIDRGRSTPSFRAIALVLGSQVLFVAGLGACGLPRRPSVGVGTLLAGLIVLGIGLAPVLVIPLMSRILLAAASAFLLAAVTRGALSALSQRDLAPEISPGALALAAAAFALWFLTTASPLYSGGHFGYHTSVAEEISQGKFLLYYFPGPDNMLSRQPQWGDLTVPHPSLFHTLTAPLALLPREWFHLTTKLFLALLLFGSTLVAALVATSAGDSRTGLYAVLTMAALPTGPQLLGLGHLMTILGVWAAAAALGFVAVQETRLERRREWLLALALLSLAFLSY
ncbi:MAG: hypothetical protein ACRD21_08320, partial [Vicinamibacteria bacterium]